MARYLITGGAGFIGSHLADALIGNEHQVDILDNLFTGFLANVPKGANFINGSILDRDLLKQLLSEVDGCFHLAAIASVPLCDEDWLVSHQVNVEGTLDVLYQAAKEHNGRKTVPVVFASSAAVYGLSEIFPLTEQSPLMPISSYGLHKVDGERYGNLAHEMYKLPFTALRLFNVYGARQRADSSYAGIITSFCHRLNEQQPLTIYGNGEQSRDFIYIKDVVRFFIQAMQTSSNSSRIFNVCTGTTTSIVEMGEILCQLYGQPFEAVFEAEREHDIYFSQGSPVKAREELGIVAETPLRDGLSEMLHFYK